MAIGEPIKLVITSEEDAWAALEAALRGDFDGPQRVNLIFEGWPSLHVHLPEGESSITPSMMEGFIALQEGLYRAHAIANRGTRKLTVLTNEEKKALEFEVKVTEGSSNFDIDAQGMLQELIKQMGQGMDGTQWLILGISVALMYFGQSAFRDWLEHKRETRKQDISTKEKSELLDSQKFVSQQETERMKILVGALKESPVLPAIEGEADNARMGFVKSLPETSHISIGEISLDGEMAKEITKNPRRRSDEVTINGSFKILRVDTTVPDGFRVRLENLNSGEMITAGVQDIFLSSDTREVIQQAEWAKKPIVAKIEAKRRGTEIIDAVIVAVQTPKMSSL